MHVLELCPIGQWGRVGERGVMCVTVFIPHFFLSYSQLSLIFLYAFSII